jgi:tRNA(Ile2) C34 agmatinyltransferase TiaS
MCNHGGHCNFCEYIDANAKKPPCNNCMWLHGFKGDDNFKCAICKKEKSPLTDDDSKT